MFRQIKLCGYIFLRCLIGVCTQKFFLKEKISFYSAFWSGPMEMWFVQNITSAYTPYNFWGIVWKLLKTDFIAFFHWYESLRAFPSPYPIYLFKVNNKNNKKACKISRWNYSDVFIFKFEYTLHLFLEFLFWNLSICLFAGKGLIRF